MDYVYKIHHLPVASPTIPLPFLAGKFASLRLSALTVSPTAFSSTFATESLFTCSQWASRLQRPALHTFIAVAYPTGTPDALQTIDSGDWIGSATLIGPTPRADWEIPESGGPKPKDDGVEGKWNMSAVFNSPSHRGKGVAKLLIQGALDFSSDESRKMGMGSRCRIIIHPSNVVVKRLYEGLGFRDAGNSTLAEAYRANGEKEMLPLDGGEAEKVKYHSRVTIAMERVVGLA